jgi:hypothetical protein
MSSLFEVWMKDGTFLERTKVFAVRDDKNGYPHFLIYELGEWKYVSAKHFIPIDE